MAGRLRLAGSRARAELGPQFTATIDGQRAHFVHVRALRFYSKAGFTPIPPFGRWVGDDTARCFEKAIVQP